MFSNPDSTSTSLAGLKFRNSSESQPPSRSLPCYLPEEITSWSQFPRGPNLPFSYTPNEVRREPGVEVPSSDGWPPAGDGIRRREPPEQRSCRCCWQLVWLVLDLREIATLGLQSCPTITESKPVRPQRGLPGISRLLGLPATRLVASTYVRTVPQAVTWKGWDWRSVPILKVRSVSPQHSYSTRAVVSPSMPGVKSRHGKPAWRPAVKSQGSATFGGTGNTY